MYGEVIRTETLTPSLVRVVLGGDGLADYEHVAFTDAYVNVALPPAGASYAAPFDPAEVRDRLAPEEWPLRRRYTVAGWDAAARELTLDFVVHGDAGAAGPWARDAAPGDRLVLTGPSGGYSPDPTADWHLMVGDESALPAIAASAAAVPAAVPLVVRLLCDGPDHELHARHVRRARRPLAAPHRRRGRRRPAGAGGARPPVPPRPRARVRARRGRRDPRRAPPPARRAPGAARAGLRLGVLATVHGRRGMAPGQARLQRGHGGRRRLSALRSRSPARAGRVRAATGCAGPPGDRPGRATSGSG